MSVQDQVYPQATREMADQRTPLAPGRAPARAAAHRTSRRRALVGAPRTPGRYADRSSVLLGGRNPASRVRTDYSPKREVREASRGRKDTWFASSAPTTVPRATTADES